MTSTVEVSSSVAHPQKYPINRGYSIELITEMSQFQELETLWNSMAFQQGFYEPFLSFDWFEIWLKHFLGDNKLLILLLYKNDELVTIAPFLRKKETFKGIRVRKIELIGNVYSPIRFFLFNKLCEREKEKNIVLIIDFLFDFYRMWDVLSLDPIPNESANFAIISSAAKAISQHQYVSFTNQYANVIESSGEEYIATLPERMIKDIQYCRRRLIKMGKYDFQLIEKPGMLDHYMELYYEVYAKSWQKREGVGPTFHRELAMIAANNRWLRLGFLFFDGCPIAAQFWLSCNDTAYILKTVYDQEYKKYSPGKVLTSEMFKHVIDIDKVKTIDYLHGDESYKNDWTPLRRERKGLMIFNKTPKGYYLCLMIKRMLPMINKYKYLSQVKTILRKYI